MNDGRPDPDKLLELVNADQSVSTRGHLKIFFGASAGVGKTYAMLSEARRLFAEGRDVLVGVVEHHGRSETAALIDGLPVLPLKEVKHRSVRLTEFDLDAALARKPGLILIDELAHTNAPGSLHPKRWLDVMTLLDNGIDVYTTLNVQHLESVNDLVARMTGIWVQETLPDRIFDEADEIALIDIPSEDLLQRLAAGKVYVAEGANRRAAENFFKKGNLTALRELALRRTADRVDAESNELSTALGQGEAPLQTRILVIIGAEAGASSLIRHVRRMATSAKAPWSAVYLQDARTERLSDKARLRLERHLRLAEKLGASVTHLIAGTDRAAAILAHARQNGYTRIVLAYERPRPLARLFSTPLARELMDAADGVEILTVRPSAGDRGEAAQGKARETLGGRMRPHPYLFALGLIGLVTGACLPARDAVTPINFAMVYLAAVVISAARLGTGPSVLASLSGILAFNFFFTEPYYSLSVTNIDYYATFAVMLVTSLVVGSLTSRLARHVEIARGNQDEIRLLYALTRTLSAVRGVEGISQAAIACLGEPIRAQVSIHVPRTGRLETFTAPGQTGATHEAREQGVVRWVLENGDLAGRHTDTLPSAHGLYLPMKVENQVIGVLGIIPDETDRQFTGMELIQFETFADLIAGTLQRAFRADEAEKSRIATENERLRNVLLASVSHDLRTPLTIMGGSIGNLLKMRKRLPREAVEELTALWQHLTRLQKFVGNLLRMTAITSGHLQLNFQPYLIQEIIGAVIAQIEPQKENRQIQTAMEGRIPMVEMDGALIEQVLVNLVENACTHTGPDGIIRIAAKVDADTLRVTVSDNGAGLPPGEEERIFESFRRGEDEKADRNRSGAGLGLAICKGIVNAHGGIILARNNSARNTGLEAKGASITFTLPLTRPKSDA